LFCDIHVKLVVYLREDCGWEIPWVKEKNVEEQKKGLLIRSCKVLKMPKHGMYG